MSTFLIGIDDTDNQTSPGTGQLARWLMRELVELGAKSLGITRHQFLVDPQIPYTTHNSGACLAVQWSGSVEGLQVAADLIQKWSAPGSDPGICIAPSESVPQSIVDWGWAATREVLTISDAHRVAESAKLFLRALGGTGQGVIGALGSVGLRRDGNEGRYLDLPGLRELPEQVTPQDLARLGIRIDHRGDATHTRTTYNTLSWVRPRLIQGKPVWPVEWSTQHDAWIPYDREKPRPLH